MQLVQVQDKIVSLNRPDLITKTGGFTTLKAAALAAGISKPEKGRDRTKWIAFVDEYNAAKAEFGHTVKKAIAVAATDSKFKGTKFHVCRDKEGNVTGYNASLRTLSKADVKPAPKRAALAARQAEMIANARRSFEAAGMAEEEIARHLAALSA